MSSYEQYLKLFFYIVGQVVIIIISDIGTLSFAGIFGKLDFDTGIL